MKKDRSKVIERIQARIKPENRQFVRKNLEISQQISHLLEERGWAQKDLARVLGKQESEISKILSGLHNITLKTLTKIEVVLDGEVIITPLEACKKYASKEYVTFYVKPNEMLDEVAEESFLKDQPVRYKGDPDQSHTVA